MNLFEMTREDFIAICRDIYGRRARGDFEAALALFDDNATFRILGSRALIPAAGLRVGKDEIREAFRTFEVDFEMVHFDVDDFVADLPRVAFVSWRMTLRSRGTGAQADIEGVDRLKWRDFKIVECVRFLDTALVAALGQTDEDSEP
ncbi:ketosteroid isomerase-like protein [Rhodoblastus acidophilus]|uniref:nuclear transport factor 2 family protein n=1 Tax=Rhodoblastus acidophilus TaxID=1074 RepID=UPI002224FF25|nr:nuclear transport factor 2 family protein [Rhodoblastus acidophilus]MCW2286597.1 ketosteroid isomerase-like protein [Rhodoblastus acidophilus]MCW2335433.1 ketosteroid isomerase-like protein [Rhodoblastus acidophilus]